MLSSKFTSQDVLTVLAPYVDKTDQENLQSIILFDFASSALLDSNFLYYIVSKAISDIIQNLKTLSSSGDIILSILENNTYDNLDISVFDKIEKELNSVAVYNTVLADAKIKIQNYLSEIKNNLSAPSKALTRRLLEIYSTTYLTFIQNYTPVLTRLTDIVATFKSINFKELVPVINETLSDWVSYAKTIDHSDPDNAEFLKQLALLGNLLTTMSDTESLFSYVDTITLKPFGSGTTAKIETSWGTNPFRISNANITIDVAGTNIVTFDSTSGISAPTFTAKLDLLSSMHYDNSTGKLLYKKFETAADDSSDMFISSNMPATVTSSTTNSYTTGSSDETWQFTVEANSITKSFSILLSANTTYTMEDLAKKINNYIESTDNFLAAVYSVTSGTPPVTTKYLRIITEDVGDGVSVSISGETGSTIWGTTTSTNGANAVLIYMNIYETTCSGQNLIQPKDSATLQRLPLKVVSSGSCSSCASSYELRIGNKILGTYYFQTPDFKYIHNIPLVINEDDVNKTFNVEHNDYYYLSSLIESTLDFRTNTVDRINISIGDVYPVNTGITDKLVVTSNTTLPEGILVVYSISEENIDNELFKLTPADAPTPSMCKTLNDLKAALAPHTDKIKMTIADDFLVFETVTAGVSTSNDYSKLHVKCAEIGTIPTCMSVQILDETAYGAPQEFDVKENILLLGYGVGDIITINGTDYTISSISTSLSGDVSYKKHVKLNTAVSSAHTDPTEEYAAEIKNKYYLLLSTMRLNILAYINALKELNNVYFSNLLSEFNSGNVSNLKLKLSDVNTLLKNINIELSKYRYMGADYSWFFDKLSEYKFTLIEHNLLKLEFSKIGVYWTLDDAVSGV